MCNRLQLLKTLLINYSEKVITLGATYFSSWYYSVAFRVFIKLIFATFSSGSNICFCEKIETIIQTI